MNELRISPELSLPLDAVTQAMAIVARRGAGKTYAARKFAEQLIKARQPIVIVDPLGAFWGLRSSADGEHEGLPVVVFGGEHGHVPLESTAGKVIADVVVEHPGAYVIDLSGFESKAAEQRFAGDFLDRLYRAKATRREALMVVVDEADIFAPQRPEPEQTRTLGALEAIVRRGRIRGLGVLLISQRAAVLNKNVLTQCEVLVAMQTTGPQDRAAIDDWIRGNGTEEERATVIGSLASLERGEAWVWSPAWLRKLVRIHVGATETFDSSRTPEAGEAAIEPRAFAKVDLDKLGARIAATVEKAKAEDPRALSGRIRDLERELASRPTETMVQTVEKIVEIPVLNGQVGELRLVVDQLAGVGAQLASVAGSITAAIDRVQPTRRLPEPVVRMSQPTTPAELSRDLVREARKGERSERADQPLGKAERSILAALAQYPDGRTKTQVALLTGYAHSGGGFNNSLGALRSKGLIEGTKERLVLTPDGQALTIDVPPLPTGSERLAMWLAQLSKAERLILEQLVAVHPEAMTKEDLGTATGYTPTGGGFNNALGRLRTLELIERGQLRASDDLVDG